EDDVVGCDGLWRARFCAGPPLIGFLGENGTGLLRFAVVIAAALRPRGLGGGAVPEGPIRARRRPGPRACTGSSVRSPMGGPVFGRLSKVRDPTEVGCGCDVGTRPDALGVRRERCDDILLVLVGASDSGV